MNHNHQKLRLQELNRYDIERTLRENISSIQKENALLLNILQEDGENLNTETVKHLLNTMHDNIAQSLRVSSVLLHEDDLSNFKNGPLVRKEELS